MKGKGRSDVKGKGSNQGVPNKFRPDDASPYLSFHKITQEIEKRLFLRNVPAGFTEDQIRDMCAEYGAVVECRVVPEKGVAFVGFDKWAAAHRALRAIDDKAQLPNSNDSQQTMYASFAERRGTNGLLKQGGCSMYSKGLPEARVFVGSLPENATEIDLRHLVEPFGKVIAANLLPLKPQAKSQRRCGYVNFAIWGEALDCVERYANSSTWPQDEKIIAVLAEPRAMANAPWTQWNAGFSDWDDWDSWGQRSKAPLRNPLAMFAQYWKWNNWSDSWGQKGSAWPSSFTHLDIENIKHHIEKRLFIRNVPSGAMEHDVRSVFEPFGRLTECRLLADKGLAFVAFETWADTHRALLATDMKADLVGSDYKRSTISVVFAERSGLSNGHMGSSIYAKGLPDARVFVKGLPEDYQDKDLLGLCEPFGRVKAASILALKPDAKIRKRCGFVNYTIWGEALDAVEAHSGDNGEIQIRLAEPRGS